MLPIIGLPSDWIMAHSSLDNAFQKFLTFCKTVTEGDREVLQLIQKRYKKTKESFLKSSEFGSLLVTTTKKIGKDVPNKYVYLREFVTELKAYGVKPERAGKRQHESDGDTAESGATDTSIIKKAKVDHRHITDDSVGSHHKGDGSNNSVGNDSKCSPETGRKLESSHVNHKHTPDYEASVGKDVESTVKSTDQEAKEETSPSQSFAVGLGLSPRKSSTPTGVRRVPLNEIKSTAAESHPAFHKGLLKNDNDDKAGTSTKSSKKSSRESQRIDIDVSESEPERARGSENQIRRLEKLLGEISREIERLEAKEMNLNDLEDEDSTYILLDKYKKKFVKVWEKLCDAKKRDTNTGRVVERKFKFEGTRYPEINRKIEKFINKHREFPDYQDVRRIVQLCAKKYQLRIGKSAMEDISRDAFTEVGNKLQERRHEDYVTNFGCHLTDGYKSHGDPALFDKSLRRRLDENRQIAKTKIEEVINKYAHKQMHEGEDTEDEENEEEEEDEEEEDDEDAPSKKDHVGSPVLIDGSDSDEDAVPGPSTRKSRWFDDEEDDEDVSPLYKKRRKRSNSLRRAIFARKQDDVKMTRKPGDGDNTSDDVIFDLDAGTRSNTPDRDQDDVGDVDNVSMATDDDELIVLSGEENVPFMNDEPSDRESETSVEEIRKRDSPDVSENEKPSTSKKDARSLLGSSVNLNPVVVLDDSLTLDDSFSSLQKVKKTKTVDTNSEPPSPSPKLSLVQDSHPDNALAEYLESVDQSAPLNVEEEAEASRSPARSLEPAEPAPEKDSDTAEKPAPEEDPPNTSTASKESESSKVQSGSSQTPVLADYVESASLTSSLLLEVQECETPNMASAEPSTKASDSVSDVIVLDSQDTPEKKPKSNPVRNSVTDYAKLLRDSLCNVKKDLNWSKRQSAAKNALKNLQQETVVIPDDDPVTLDDDEDEDDSASVEVTRRMNRAVPQCSPGRSERNPSPAKDAKRAVVYLDNAEMDSAEFDVTDSFSSQNPSKDVEDLASESGVPSGHLANTSGSSGADQLESVSSKTTNNHKSTHAGVLSEQPDILKNTPVDQKCSHEDNDPVMSESLQPQISSICSLSTGDTLQVSMETKQSANHSGRVSPSLELCTEASIEPTYICSQSQESPLYNLDSLATTVENASVDPEVNPGSKDTQGSSLVLLPETPYTESMEMCESHVEPESPTDIFLKSHKLPEISSEKKSMPPSSSESVDSTMNGFLSRNECSHPNTEIEDDQSFEPWQAMDHTDDKKSSGPIEKVDEYATDDPTGKDVQEKASEDSDADKNLNCSSKEVKTTSQESEDKKLSKPGVSDTHCDQKPAQVESHGKNNLSSEKPSSDGEQKDNCEQADRDVIELSDSDNECSSKSSSKHRDRSKRSSEMAANQDKLNDIVKNALMQILPKSKSSLVSNMKFAVKSLDDSKKCPDPVLKSDSPVSPTAFKAADSKEKPSTCAKMISTSTISPAGTSTDEPSVSTKVTSFSLATSYRDLQKQTESLVSPSKLKLTNDALQRASLSLKASLQSLGKVATTTAETLEKDTAITDDKTVHAVDESPLCGANGSLEESSSELEKISCRKNPEETMEDESNDNTSSPVEKTSDLTVPAKISDATTSRNPISISSTSGTTCSTLASMVSSAVMSESKLTTTVVTTIAMTTATVTSPAHSRTVTTSVTSVPKHAGQISAECTDGENMEDDYWDDDGDSMASQSLLPQGHTSNHGNSTLDQPATESQQETSNDINTKNEEDASVESEVKGEEKSSGGEDDYSISDKRANVHSDQALESTSKDEEGELEEDLHIPTEDTSIEETINKDREPASRDTEDESMVEMNDKSVTRAEPPSTEQYKTEGPEVSQQGDDFELDVSMEVDEIDEDDDVSCGDDGPSAVSAPIDEDEEGEADISFEVVDNISTESDSADSPCIIIEDADDLKEVEEKVLAEEEGHKVKAMASGQPGPSSSNMGKRPAIANQSMAGKLPSNINLHDICGRVVNKVINEKKNSNNRPIIPSTSKQGQGMARMPVRQGVQQVQRSAGYQVSQGVPRNHSVPSVRQGIQNNAPLRTIGTVSQVRNPTPNMSQNLQQGSRQGAVRGPIMGQQRFPQGNMGMQKRVQGDMTSRQVFKPRQGNQMGNRFQGVQMNNVPRRTMSQRPQSITGQQVRQFGNNRFQSRQVSPRNNPVRTPLPRPQVVRSGQVRPQRTPVCQAANITGAYRNTNNTNQGRPRPGVLGYQQPGGVGNLAMQTYQQHLAQHQRKRVTPNMAPRTVQSSTGVRPMVQSRQPSSQSQPSRQYVNSGRVRKKQRTDCVIVLSDSD